MKKVYEYRSFVRLHATDAAGVMYYSQLFILIHEAYESLLDSLGISLADIIRNKPYLLPIVHASADYSMPAMVGDRLYICINSIELKEKSYTVYFEVKNQDKKVVATAKTTHTAQSKNTRKSIKLPEEIRTLFTKNQPTRKKC